jgi:SH3-like domain-containing protein
MHNPVFRVVRWIVPWIALGAVLYYVWGATADFRLLKTGTSGTATQTVDATSTPVTGMTGIAKVDGVHIRDVPAAGGTVLADLRKDAAFEVLAQQPGWYRIKDAAGHIGWITSDASFVAVEQK